ncbi:RNA 2',3'-cyclic phosphodiesterase [Kyrpidia tusciae]|uniref:RNA 2',3'-cyclic phosphodiesterase n=1 Tax=Kyrpidia tusciae (strain DSM 2912 / NBRC 15312 / T2) TaxID=562970 RepID=D5WTR1_KYRT2|nr:RNA 2',3'-cyclic phosphodiesterase [Kyrpidia tusciae]ADG05231.1 2'-5' RNA ligase [Kyrpidia tusciae DSM 2912]
MGRYFWGIGVPEEIGLRMEEWIADRGGQIPVKRWYRSVQFHVTLLFFGDLIDANLEEAHRAAEEAAEATASFVLTSDGVGAFSRSRVVWLGLKASPPLFALRRRLWEVAVSLNAADNDRPTYRPHITLGRLSRPWDPTQVDPENLRLLKGLQFPVDRFHLYESRLSPAGPEYRIVRSFMFLGEKTEG